MATHRPNAAWAAASEAVSLAVWVGLLGMLEDYACTWDDPRGMP